MILTSEDVIQYTNNLFPGNFGIIVSGSQQLEKEYRKDADIDLVVFDIVSSAVWRTILEKDGYRLEFIVIPATDISAVLDNGLFDSKKTLLAFCCGRILHDPKGVLRIIKRNAEFHSQKVTSKSLIEYEKYAAELIKIPNLLKQSLLQSELISTLSSFVYLSSQVELYRKSGRFANDKLKIRRLNEYSPDFLNNISNLFIKGLAGDIAPISSFIEIFLLNNNVTATGLLFKNGVARFTINFPIKTQSKNSFYKEILPALYTDSVFGGLFLFSFISPNNYKDKFRYNMNTVFKTGTYQEVLNLVSVFSQLLKENGMEYTPKNYILEESDSQLYSENYDYLRKIIAKLFLEQFMYDSDSEKAVQLSFIINLYLKERLQIGTRDFMKIASFISQKYILSQEEQEHLFGYPQILNAQKGKINAGEQFYKTYLPDLLQFVLFDKDLLKTKFDGAIKIFETIDNICNDLDITQEPDESITFQVIKSLEFERLRAVLLYKEIMELVLEMLNIPDFRKFTILYACNKAIAELDRVELPNQP